MGAVASNSAKFKWALIVSKEFIHSGSLVALNPVAHQSTIS
jgi:hypothetical protein